MLRSGVNDISGIEFGRSFVNEAIRGTRSHNLPGKAVDMTLLHPHRINRRAVLARSAAAVALAGLVQAGMSPVSGRTPAARDEYAALVDANTGFALDLYRELRAADDGNLLFSPYSISLALAMTYAGAEGETATEMADVLSFDPGDAAIHDAFGTLTADIVARGNAVASDLEGTSALRIANALWGEQSFPFDPAFVEEVATHYDGGLERTDFLNAPDAAREEINSWVEEQTDGRIEAIVPEDVISGLTRLVLANAIAFSSGWRTHFAEEYTGDAPFSLQDGTSVEVPFMFRARSYPYARLDSAHLVELAYAADGFAMTFIMPDEGEFDAVEASLDTDSLQDMVGQLESTQVELFLPRFGFESAASLPDILQALGMTAAFDPEVADFSGMVEGAAAENLFIGDVLHKAFISVDEEGTDAAAATIIATGPVSAPQPEEEPVELAIDRPFLFLIRDTRTGTILFLGRVMNPLGA